MKLATMKEWYRARAKHSSEPQIDEMNLMKEGNNMSLSDERMQILKMLEERTITAEEAAKLLSALEAGAKQEEEASKPRSLGRETRWLRIRVTDQTSGKQKVNVNVPMSLVNVGMKIGAKFIPQDEDFDLNEIFEAIKSGAEGKIVEVEDDGDGERVEIFVE